MRLGHRETSLANSPRQARKAPLASSRMTRRCGTPARTGGSTKRLAQSPPANGDPALLACISDIGRWPSRLTRTAHYKKILPNLIWRNARADRSFCEVEFPHVAKRCGGLPDPPARAAGKDEPLTRRGFGVHWISHPRAVTRHPRKGPLNGSNTERMFQAPFARRNALGVAPNRFLKVIVMCCCEEKPDAAETSEIADLVLSSKLQAC